MYYTEAETLKVSSQKDNSELKIAADLASQFYWKNFKNEGISIARLKGKLLMENGRYHLLMDDHDRNSSRNMPLVHWSLPDSEKLLAALSKVSINVETISTNQRQAAKEHGMDGAQTLCTVHTLEPYKALIEIGTASTNITTADPNVASVIYKAIDSILNEVS